MHVNFKKCWPDMKSRDQMNIFPTPPPVRICSYAIGTLCSPKVLVKYALLSEHLRFDARVCKTQWPLGVFSTISHLTSVQVQQEMRRVTNARNNGEQELVYKNNSPDTLTKVFYHLYYNAFQPGSMMDARSRTIQDPDHRVEDRIFHLNEEM